MTVAEFEAMRLKHYLGMNQKESAERMGISQPTFSRTLESAHRKNTLALLEGKKILIQGGNFETKFGFKGYGCNVCNHEWEDPTASKEKLKTINCVKCNSNNVYHLIREYL